MSLNELLGWSGPLTHRQFQVWNRWRMLDLNHPSRSDLYAAQIAAEVRRSALNYKSKVSTLDLIIELQDKGVKRKLTEAERKHEIEMSKAAWLARMVPPKSAKPKN